MQLSVTSGTSYAVPAVGTITSWSTNAAAGGGQTFTLKVFRKFADPAFYAVVGHDGPRPLTGGLVNTFPASIAVKPGDLIGLHTTGSANTACTFAAPGDQRGFRVGDLADGATGAFAQLGDFRLNIAAVLEPSNAFTLGKAKLNKKKGTATLSVEVPNLGTLVLGGKGVKAASAEAVTSKKVGAPGKVKLVIKAKGKQAKTLKKNGKVKLKAKITYTPTGGGAATQTKKLKLKLKRKKR